jgi:hypothetical protein
MQSYEIGRFLKTTVLKIGFLRNRLIGRKKSINWIIMSSLGRSIFPREQWSVKWVPEF